MSAPKIPDVAAEAREMFANDVPVPLRPRRLDVPFPVEVLPGPYEDMARAVAETAQVDPAMPAVTVLAVVAAAAGGCVEVEVRRGWREPVNIFTATVAAPGERKSAVQAVLTDPVAAAEEKLAAESRARRVEQETLRTIAVKDAERARSEAVRAKGEKRKAAEAEATAAAAVADAITVPPVTRLVADDVTAEAAASLMAEQKRLAIISAEGGVFDILAGRYSGNIPNLDLWLKGHAGDRLRIDRKGRAPEYVKKPALTVGLMIQPAVLDAIGRNAHFRGRGLLDRFLYAYPPSRVGWRRADVDPVPDPVADAYTDSVAALVADLAGYAGDPFTLTLTDNARARVVDLLRETEVELRDDGVLAPIRQWGSKYVGATVRIAALLHLAGHGADTGMRRAVDRETVEHAALVGAYFKANALRVYDVMGTDRVMADAGILLDKAARLVEETGSDEFTKRDLFNMARGRFRRVSDLDVPLDVLLEHGWLLRLPGPERAGPGRRPSPKYLAHPLLVAQSADSAQPGRAAP